MWTLFAVAAVLRAAFGFFAWHDVRQSALNQHGSSPGSAGEAAKV